MSDQPIDPFEARLVEQLRARSERMPIRGDALAEIRRGARRRHRTRVAAWSAATLVLVLTVIGGAAFGSRSDDSAPYVDTTPTTDLKVPATIPAEPLPAIAPPSGRQYAWRIASWSGPSAYMLVVTEWGAEAPIFLLRVQRAPWPTSSTETVNGPDGQVITVDRSGTNEVDLSWELEPGVTASVGIGSFANVAGDPVQRGLQFIDSLQEVDAATWQASVRGFFDFTYVLTDEPSRTSLAEARADIEGRPSSDTAVNLWAPGVGWGQLTLQARNSFQIRPSIGTPIAVRGVTGDLVEYAATDSGERLRYIEWTEDSRTYVLTFGAPISTEQAVATANQLALIPASDVDELLFPTWQPAGMTDMQLLPAVPNDG